MLAPFAVAAKDLIARFPNIGQVKIADLLKVGVRGEPRGIGGLLSGSGELWLGLLHGW